MNYDTKNPILAQKARDYLERLIGSGATVEVKQIRRNRSKWQNNWYWAVVKQVSDFTGYEKEEAAIVIKRACGLVYERHGSKFLRSTADLDTKEFTDFMDRLIRWASQELNIVVEDPDQYRG